MNRTFDPSAVRPLLDRLTSHPVYGALHDMDDLRLFMGCHVFSVWDFMSLVKYLQHKIAPTTVPWRPHRSGSVRRFMNALVLEEESDEGPPDENGNVSAYASHFELYCGAMREIGGDPAQILGFVETASNDGITAALQMNGLPEPSRAFVGRTFQFIESGKPHAVAAALALGREHIIPSMFRTFLARMEITESQAPIFYYYLKRHIHLDEDFHGPFSLELLNELCDGDEQRLKEARDAAEQAILARIRFWDGVGELLAARRR